MIRGIYASASGMLTGLARQEVWSNNLANAQTPGYRQDEVILRSFPEELLFRYEQGAAANVAVGRLGMGADAAAMATSDAPGRIVETGSPLDVALEGPGFLAVRTAGGIRYTRHGRLNVDQQGYLCSGPGQRLLGPDGQAVAVPLGADLQITPEGVIEAGGQAIGQLALWRFADASALRKEGANLFVGQGAMQDTGQTRLRQRSVELPNTDPVLAVTEMLSILRAYEASQRALQAQDETLGKAVNEVGRV